MNSNSNTWGDGILLACHEQRLDIPVTEKTIFYRCSFMPFKKMMIEIYSELVQNGVFTHFYRGMDMMYSLQYEILKCCPYHNATDYNIEKCLDFCHASNPSSIWERFNVA